MGDHECRESLWLFLFLSFYNFQVQRCRKYLALEIKWLSYCTGNRKGHISLWSCPPTKDAQFVQGKQSTPLLNLCSPPALENKWQHSPSYACRSVKFSNLFQNFINRLLRGLALYIGGAGHCLSGRIESAAYVCHHPHPTVTEPEIPTIRVTTFGQGRGLWENPC
jgi:hypothetical protein